MSSASVIRPSLPRVGQAGPLRVASGSAALDFEATDLEQLKELRADVAELIARDGSSALSHVRPWLWSATTSGGRPLTDAGASVGYELRLS